MAPQQIEVPSVASSLQWWDGASEHGLQAALAAPTTTCIEAGLNQSEAGRAFDPAACNGLGLRVTTRSVCRHRVVQNFIAAIEDRIPLNQDLRTRIQTAVQEAVMNAVMHGNLKIEPKLRNSLDGLAKMQQAMDEKLAKPESGLAEIRMEAGWTALMLSITIQDSGDGYDELAARKTVAEAASGRGLAILLAFCDGVVVLNGGTTVKLEFRR